MRHGVSRTVTRWRTPTFFGGRLIMRMRELTKYTDNIRIVLAGHVVVFEGCNSLPDMDELLPITLTPTQLWQGISHLSAELLSNTGLQCYNLCNSSIAEMRPPSPKVPVQGLDNSSCGQSDLCQSCCRSELRLRPPDLTTVPCCAVWSASGYIKELLREFLAVYSAPILDRNKRAIPCHSHLLYRIKYGFNWKEEFTRSYGHIFPEILAS